MKTTFTKFFSTVLFLYAVCSSVIAQQGGNALTFDGTTQYVEAPSGNIPVSGDFTVSVWAKHDHSQNNGTGYYEILSQGTAGNAFYIGRNASGLIRVGQAWNSTTNFPVDDLWHNYTVVKTATNTFLYLDGSLVETKGGTIPNPVNTTFMISHQFVGYEEHFKGSIDEIKIWSLALSNCDIAENYDKIVNINENGLVAYYNFDQNSTTLTDIKGGNNGTLINAPVWVASTAGITGTAADVIVSTGGSSSVTATSAAISGEITYGTATSRGVVYGTNSCPTVSGAKTVESGSFGTGSFLANITGLITNTTYYAHAYATNASGTSYGDELIFTTPLVAPTVQASAITFASVQATEMTIGWTNGDGVKRAVFVKESSGSITNPTDHTTYTASANWAIKGTQLGISGYYCVFNSADNSFTLTGLSLNTQYTVQVFEYNGSEGAEMYNTAAATNNPKAQTTTAVPIITSFSPATGSVGSTVTISGTNFNATPTSNIVYFGGVKASVTAASNTSLAVTVPVGAANMPISITNSYGLTAFSNTQFRVNLLCPLTINSNSFSVSTPISLDNSSFNSPQTGDLDGDGKIDIVSLSNTAAKFTVLRNTSSGSVSFLATAFSTGESPRSVKLIDMDGDGKLEVVVVCGAVANSIAVHLNTSTSGSVSFAEPYYLSGGGSIAGQLAYGDFDSDGKTDFVYSDNGNGLRVVKNNSTIGTISLAVSQVLNTVYAPHIAVADIDKDGKPDVVSTGVGSAIYVYRNTTSGSISFATATSISSAYYNYITVGDFDNDGKMDICGASSSGGAAIQNTSSVGSLSFGSVASVPLGSFSIVMNNDMDGDGNLDLITGNLSTGFSVSTANLSAGFSSSNINAAIPFATPFSYPQITTGDIDGDGKMDVIASSGTQLVVYTNASTAGVTPSVTIAASSNPICNGGSMTITATPTNGGSNPTFSFYVNSLQVQSSLLNTFTSTLNNNDQVYCVLNATNACQTSSTANSNTITVSLYAATVIENQSTASQTQCINGAFNAISVSASGRNLTYQWYVNTIASNNGGTLLGSANGAQTNSYTPQVGTAASYYYCVVTGTCGMETSDVSGAFIVDPASVGGTVDGGTTICAGRPGGLLTLSSHTGNIIKWQSSVSPFSSWSDILYTADTYTPGTLTETTQFRAVVQNGVCAEEHSNPTTVTVVQPSLRRYVTVAGSGAFDGTSWDNAYPCNQLQTAINEACVNEVWVAQGVYHSTDIVGDGSERYSAFMMKEGVAIYGGFAGTETLLSQRNWTVNVSLLSGDIGTIGDNSDNCYHVVLGFDIDATAVLDGFTITEGNADGDDDVDRIGAGFCIVDGSPSISNCIVSGGLALAGGGVANLNSSPTYTNITISGNSVTYYGGGVFNMGASPIFINTAINGNSADIGGGGIYNMTSSPVLTNTTISGNSASEFGGGICNFDNSNPILINAVINENLADEVGGAVFNGNSSPVFINATLISNSANRGGGIYSDLGSAPSFNNCIVWGNTATFEGNQFYNHDEFTTTTLNYTCYENGTNDLITASGATITATNNNITADPLFVDAAGGDYRIYGVSPCADAGNNSYNFEPNDVRGEGFGRKLNKNEHNQLGTIDMGAYEYKEGTDFLSCPNPLYVTFDGGATVKDGLSWSTAYDGTQLQQAINKSCGEVWVAAGTYKPTTDNNRLASFQMKNGVAIYGGFAGTETLFSQRNLSANVTILSGDIGMVNDNSDNSYHVVTCSGNDATAALNGFTITNGKADGIDSPKNLGGGIFNENGSASISNCIISGNSASHGGGIFNASFSLILTNTIISDNSAENGGGIYNAGSSSTLINNTISDNSAEYGGGIYNAVSSSILTNTTISDNSAEYGGGIYNFNTSSSTLNNCIVWGNTAAIMGNQVVVDESTMTLNYSCYGDETGDVYINGGTLTATNNNVTSDPLFVDEAGGDFRIMGISPCADAGNDSYNSEPYDIRGEGFDRKLSKTDGSYGAIDMGAYEYKYGNDFPSNIIYVDAAKTDDTGDGFSWASAKKTLQSAINLVPFGFQIWVKAGTYLPTEESGGSGARYKTFTMKSGVAIFGGFQGTETSLNDRQIADFPAILSGDLNGDDDYSSADWTGTTENVFHVVYVSQTSLSHGTSLDGLTIRGGNADGSGGKSEPSEGMGGGIYLQTNDGYSNFLQINNCTFQNNYSNSGGAIAILNDESLVGQVNQQLFNCNFHNNIATDYGGAVYGIGPGSVTYNNCTFAGNFATYGGGIASFSGITQNFNNCIIWSNWATSIGNQFYIFDNSNLPKGAIGCILEACCYSNDLGDVFFLYSSLFNSDSEIVSDPVFVSAANSDYRICGISPCADQGDNSIDFLSTDIRGSGFGRKLLKTDHAQVGTIDIGAYEYQEGTDPLSPCANPTDGGEIAEDQLICYNTAPVAFTSTSLPTGQTGTLEYQWQLSTTDASSGFEDIASANSVSYLSGNLSRTTWFKRKARVSCVSDWTGAVTSNTITITINDEFTPGTITSTGETICYNTNPTSSIGSTTIAGGGDGVVTYSWRSSSDGYATAISGASLSTYTPAGPLTTTTSYKRYAKDGTCSDFVASSGVWSVTVSPVSVGGSISGGSNVCTGTNSTTLTLINYTGNVLKWQSSVDNWQTVVDISNTTTTLIATDLTQTTQYRAVVQSGVCAETISLPTTITVHVPAAVAYVSITCVGNPDKSITYTAYPQYGGTPGYQWFKNGTPVATGGAYTHVAQVGDEVHVVMQSSLTCVVPVQSEGMCTVRP